MSSNEINDETLLNLEHLCMGLAREVKSLVYKFK